MAFTGKALADGQLPSSKGTLYTVPGSTTTYVKWISVHNTSGSTTETVLIYVNTSGTSRVIARVVLLPNEHARILSDGEAFILEAADLIEGVSTNATTVDYFISGVQEA